MPNSKLILPGNFEAGKRYWLKGETLKAWQTALLSDRIVAGVGLREFETPQGRILYVPPVEDLPHLILKEGSQASKFRVTPGTVNDLMPTMNGVRLDAEEPPEIEVLIPTSFWIRVVGVFSPQGYTVTIVTSPTEDVPSGTEITATGFTSFRKIGFVSVEDGGAIITQNRSGGDLAVESFGCANFWWLT